MISTRFDHDCINCVFIGRLDERDVYGCNCIDGLTIILRYGSEGSEYQSYPLEMLIDRLFKSARGFRCKDCGSDYEPLCHCKAEGK